MKMKERALGSEIKERLKNGDTEPVFMQLAAHDGGAGKQQRLVEWPAPPDGRCVS